MALKTSLEGRVQNTSLPSTHALLPLEEALVNSIQAIEALHLIDGSARGRIVVEILRSPQTALHMTPLGPGPTPREPIIGFVISDNGIGFTDENMASFETLDSRHKANIGARGVGRLMWLKAFRKVRVNSTYRGPGGEWRTRRFAFSVEQEVSDQMDGPSDAGEAETTIHLEGFRDEYRKRVPKTVSAIAGALLDHTLWYFIREGGAPEIIVADEQESLALDDLYEEYAGDSRANSRLEVQNIRFDMVSLRLRSSRAGEPMLHWCAGSRVVKSESLTGAVPGLRARLRDAIGDFTYECFLTSHHLDTAVRSDRTAFDIPEETSGTLLEDELSLASIREQVYADIELKLADELAVARAIGKERVSNFVREQAPRYRPVLARFDDSSLTVDPSVKDRELELLLHTKLQDFEYSLLQEGQTVLDEAATPPPDYEQRLAEYLGKVDELKKSDLAGYVAGRRVVLDLLERMIETDASGNYVREDHIHRLLMPMRVDSNQVASDAANLWIIDERLAFHEYLASDKPLRSVPITGDNSTKEPDILALKLDGPILVSETKGPDLASIVVVEIKRPMRNDAAEDDKDPINQALGYLERVRSGGVKTSFGRPIPGSQEIPGFCYVIADLTPRMVARCKQASLTKAYDGQSYFGFNPNYNSYIEVISFDGLLKAARQRNRSFFDRLDLPV